MAQSRVPVLVLAAPTARTAQPVPEEGKADQLQLNALRRLRHGDTSGGTVFPAVILVRRTFWPPVNFEAWTDRRFQPDIVPKLGPPVSPSSELFGSDTDDDPFRVFEG